MKYEFLNYTVEDGTIAVLALNNPKRLNALSFRIYDEIRAAVSEIEADPKLRVLVLCGSETVFGAGADVTDLQALDSVEAGYRCSKRSHEICDRIERLPFPTIAAIAGFAFGGCLELALACDLRVAAPSAKLALPEITLGLLPGSGGTQRLPKLVGASRAKELMFLGTTVRAEEAYRLGLVNRLAEEGALLESAMELARKISAGAPVALSLIKAAVNYGGTLETGPAMEMEARAFGALFDTADAREGMRAFVEKRPPKFEGR